MSEETRKESKTWTETLRQRWRFAGTLNNLFHDVTVSRVIVRNKKGHTLVDIPFTIGAVGVILTLPYSVILLGVMWLTEFDVAVERHLEESEAETAAPQPDMEAAAAPPPAPDSAVEKSAEPKRCWNNKSGTQCKRTAQAGSDYWCCTPGTKVRNQVTGVIGYQTVTE